MGLPFDRVGEKDIGPLFQKEVFRDLFDGKDDGAGRKVLGYDDAFPPEVLIGKHPDRGGLNPDLQGKLPQQLSGVDGDQGDASFPRILVLAADTETYLGGQFSSLKGLNYDINRGAWSIARSHRKTPLSSVYHLNALATVSPEKY
jgi:hypothetical protein